MHFSTDCVFSGRRGGYTETDEPDPVDLYGRTKLLGEVDQPPGLTLRTSIIGLEERAQTTGLIEWFLAQRGTIKGFRRAIYTGLTTAAMARWSARSAGAAPRLHGLWHVASEPISKYDLLVDLAKKLGRTTSRSCPDDDFFCDRSLRADAFLRRHRRIGRRRWDEMLAELAGQIRERQMSVGRLRVPGKCGLLVPRVMSTFKTLDLTGKRILVTGGTGSLGQVLVKRLLGGQHGLPKKVIVLSRDEAKQHEMRLSYLNRQVSTDEVIYRNFEQVLEFRIGDVRVYSDVASALGDADIVFNAAALKQVPVCEYFPEQAVLTNCVGAANIVRAIGEQKLPVETVVGISTDKACKPVNVMGMTKAVAERIFTAANVLNAGRASSASATATCWPRAAR